MPLDGTAAVCVTAEPSPSDRGPLAQSVYQERDLPPAWVEVAEDTFRRLLELEPGWDSYGAPQLSPAATDMATIVLRTLARILPRLPAPVISPTSAGGVEIEWAAGELVASLEFQPGPSMVLYYDDGEREVESISPDFDPFVRTLARIIGSPG